MRQIIDQELCIDGKEPSFHNFRHYVQNQLDNSGLEDKLVRDVIGYKGKDTHEKIYRKSAPLPALTVAIGEAA